MSRLKAWIDGQEIHSGMVGEMHGILSQSLARDLELIRPKIIWWYNSVNKHSKIIQSSPTTHHGDRAAMFRSIELVVFKTYSSSHDISTSEISERDSSPREEGQGEKEGASSEIQEEGNGSKEEETEDCIQDTRFEWCRDVRSV